LVRPKSTTYSTLRSVPVPNRQLSGRMSRYTKPHVWICSRRDICTQ
jgi:hypothetical protein